MENSRYKQFIGFELCSILSSMMNSPSIPLLSARDVDHPFVQRTQRTHYLPMSHAVALGWQAACHCTAVLACRPPYGRSPKAAPQCPHHLTSRRLISQALCHLSVARRVSVAQEDISRQRPHSPNFNFGIFLYLVCFISYY